MQTESSSGTTCANTRLKENLEQLFVRYKLTDYENWGKYSRACLSYTSGILCKLYKATDLRGRNYPLEGEFMPLQVFSVNQKIIPKLRNQNTVLWRKKNGLKKNQVEITITVHIDVLNSPKCGFWWEDPYFSVFWLPVRCA